MKPSPAKLLLVASGAASVSAALRDSLENAGYEIHEGQGPEQSLALIAEQCPDLILAEEGAARDLLKLLRATANTQPESGQAPVVVVADGANPEAQLDAWNSGASDVFVPPIRAELALARIAAHIERKRSRDALQDRALRLELSSKGNHDGLWDWQLRKGRFHLSASWKAILGYEDSEIPDEPEQWISRVHEEDRERLQLLLSDVSSDHGPNELLSEHRMLHKGGLYRWVQVRGGVHRDPFTGAAIRIAGVMTDITSKRIYDPMTGLPNRAFFMDAVDQAIHFAAEHRGFGFGVLLLNLDRYGIINNVFGHPSGDQLLVETASRLQRAVRSSEGGESHLVGYLGGDEFAVLLGGLDDLGAAQQAAARVQSEFGHAFLLEGTEVYASATIGIALWHEGYKKATEILRDADVAMRTGKKKGEARIMVFDLTMQRDSLRKLELSLEVQRGLDLNEFEIYYQPVIRLDNGSVAGFEGLLRWRHPARGVLAPSDFLEHAEQTGLVIPLGVFTLRHAAVSARQLHHRFPSSPGLHIGVNVSPREVLQPGLASRVEEVLTTAGVTPSSLVLEINQRVFHDGGETAALALGQVKALGVRLRLDNANLEPASLRYLSRGLFDSVKISRAIVNAMTSNEQQADVLRTLCMVAKGLGIESLVEGVETSLQAEVALSAGCGYAQGFLFAPPLTIEDALEYLARLDQEPVSH